MIAALFVDPRGCYAELPDVDLWDERRDAREYPGPHRVVAHPPCSRWCRLAGLVQARWGHRIGDDGGCFRSALAAVRKWGGVLEHPAYSKAWAAHGLLAPPTGGDGFPLVTGEAGLATSSRVATGTQRRKRRGSTRWAAACPRSSGASCPTARARRWSPGAAITSQAASHGHGSARPLRPPLQLSFATC